MDTFNWTYIAALFSVAFGWFLNELGQWFRTRKEDKRIKRQVLFYLLEIHFTFHKLDIEPVIELVTQKVLDRFPPEEQTDHSKQVISHFYKGVVSDIMEENVAESLAEMEEHYTKSILELSKLDPITAYRLNGKNKIFGVFDLLHHFYDEARKALPDESELNEQIELAVKSVKPEILKEAISDSEDEIKEIALSVNLWTWYRSRQVVRNTKIKVRSDTERKVEDFISMIMQKSE